MTQTMTRKATKPELRFAGRAEFKANGYILYRIQSGEKQYEVTVVAGKITGCAEFVEAKEQERIALEQKINRDLEAHIEDDIRVNRIVDGKLVSCYWNELPEEERRAAYCSDFGIYGG